MKKLSLRRMFLIVLLFCLSLTCALSVKINKKKVYALSNSDIVCEGFDISFWQDDVNFARVHQKAEFLILRIGYGTSLDRRFLEYANGALNEGIDLGVYIYSIATTVDGVIEEANWVIDQIEENGYSGKFNYPIYFDYEESDLIDNSSNEFNTAMVNAWTNTIRARGYYPGLYMGGARFTNNIYRDQISCDSWVAAYGFNGDVSSFYNRYGHSSVKMWQWESTPERGGYTGTDWGVSTTGLDCNYCFVDYPSIIEGGGYNGYNGNVGDKPRVDGDRLYLNECNSLIGWSTGYGAELSLVPATNPVGNSVHINTDDSKCIGNNANVGSMAFFNFNGESVNLYEYNMISFELYCDEDYTTVYRPADYFQINFYTSGQDGFNYNIPSSQIKKGWHTYTVCRYDIPKAVEDADWGNITGMRYTWFNESQSSWTIFGLDTIYAYKDVSARKEGDKLYLTDCDTLTGWSTGYDTSLSLERAYNPAGYDIVMNANTYLGNNANVGSMAFFNFKDDYYANLYEYSSISFELFCSIDYASAGRDGDLFQVNFYTDGQDGFNAVVPVSQIHSGWQVITLDRYSIGKAVDSAKWNQIKGIRFTWFNNTQGDRVTFGLDTVYASKEAKPRKDGDRLYINECDSLYGWTTEYNTSLSLGEAQNPAGNFVKINANSCIGNISSIGSLAKYSLGDNSADASSYNTLYLELYSSIDYSTNALRENDYFQINFITSGNDGYKYDILASDIKEGWNNLELKLSNFIKVSDADWSNIKEMRFTWFNVSQGEAVEFALDTLYLFNKEYPSEPETPDSSSSRDNSSSNSSQETSSSSSSSSSQETSSSSAISSSSSSQETSSSSAVSSKTEQSSSSKQEISSSSNSSQEASSSTVEASSKNGSSGKKGCKSSLGGSSVLIVLCLISLIAIAKRKKN